MSFVPYRPTRNKPCQQTSRLAAIATFTALLVAVESATADDAGSPPAERCVSEAAAVDEAFVGCRKGAPRGLEHANKMVVNCGYLIVDSRYIPPPYVIRRDGKRLAVNGVMLDEDRVGDKRVGPLHEIFARDGVVIRFRDGSIAAYFNALVLGVLMADTNRSAKIGLLDHQFPTCAASAPWSQLVDDFEPNEELKQRVRDFRQRCEQRFAALPVAESVGHRFKLYTLTVIGMTLTVLAFGLVLSYRPQFAARWREVDRSAESVRLVFGCAALIVLLSLFDLACTLLARTSVGFWEINPLGAALAAQPVSLIVLKMAATVVSVSIILVLRFYRASQVACWWVTVGLALLAARWVMFNSLMMG